MPQYKKEKRGGIQTFSTASTKNTRSFWRKWSWVFLFIAFCYSFYMHAMQKKEGMEEELTQRLEEIEQEKQLALQEREELLMHIHSQTDPAWIQMTLMKGLGLVPEGQQKVYFEKKEE